LWKLIAAVSSVAKTTTMYFLLPAFLFIAALISCIDAGEIKEENLQKRIEDKNPHTLKEISLPPGFNFYKGADSVFSSWLLDMKLRKDKTVYLHNGKHKTNQQAQFAVLDIDIGNRNLVQCADAAIKLRADYLFQSKRFGEIVFFSTSGERLSFNSWRQGYRWKERNGKLVVYAGSRHFSDDEKTYQAFMELVYSYCGTYSLSRQLVSVGDIRAVQSGDIFVQGGFPGHAVIVVAVAKNAAGGVVFLLAQGYMPAQDIHILKNPMNTDLSPWYSIEEIHELITPQWVFKKEALMRW
jgi:hypothetical protein